MQERKGRLMYMQNNTAAILQRNSVSMLDPKDSSFTNLAIDLLDIIANSEFVAFCISRDGPS